MGMFVNTQSKTNNVYNMFSNFLGQYMFQLPRPIYVSTSQANIFSNFLSQHIFQLPRPTYFPTPQANIFSNFLGQYISQLPRPIYFTTSQASIFSNFLGQAEHHSKNGHIFIDHCPFDISRLCLLYVVFICAISLLIIPFPVLMSHIYFRCCLFCH